MGQQVLDLDRDVVAHVRVPGRKRLDDPTRVGRAVEEVGVAEGDVLRAGVHLLGDVRHHDIVGHDAQRASVHGHDRAMRTGVQAAARGLGVAGEPPLAARCSAGRTRPVAAASIGRARGTPAAAAASRGRAVRPPAARCAPAPRAPAPLRRRARASHPGPAASPRSSARRDRTTARIASGRSSRSRDSRGPASRVAACIGTCTANIRACRTVVWQERLPRQVDGSHLETGLPEPRRGRGEAERRPPQLVRGQKHDHRGECTVWKCAMPRCRIRMPRSAMRDSTEGRLVSSGLDEGRATGLGRVPTGRRHQASAIRHYNRQV